MGFKLWGVISALCLLLCLLICFKIPNGLNMFPLFFSGGLKKKKNLQERNLKLIIRLVQVWGGKQQHCSPEMARRLYGKDGGAER